MKKTKKNITKNKKNTKGDGTSIRPKMAWSSGNVLQLLEGLDSEDRRFRLDAKVASSAGNEQV